MKTTRIDADFDEVFFRLPDPVYSIGTTFAPIYNVQRRAWAVLLVRCFNLQEPVVFADTPEGGAFLIASFRTDCPKDGPMSCEVSMLFFTGADAL